MTEQRTVIALIGDLFFESRLAPMVARASGKLRLARTLDQLGELVAAEPPTLVIVNLAMRQPRPIDAIAEAKQRADVPVIAFGPHMDVEARRQALAAGADRWLPNSKLTTDLPTMLAAVLAGHPLAGTGSISDDD